LNRVERLAYFLLLTAPQKSEPPDSCAVCRTTMVLFDGQHVDDTHEVYFSDTLVREVGAMADASVTRRQK